MNVPALRVHIALNSVTGGWNESVPPNRNPYLWTVFFKVDGDTVALAGLALKGTASVTGTPGDQGDLGDAPVGQFGGEWQVSASLGSYVTTMNAIATPLGQFPGVVGCVAVLWDWEDTPGDAVAAGHAAFNQAIQQGLNQLIPTFGIRKQALTQADIDNLTNQVTTAVGNAEKNQLDAWQKALLVTVQTPDSPLNQAVLVWNQATLATSAPGGIPIRQINTITGPVGPQGSHTGKTEFLQGWDISGTVIADPLPLSLHRILTGLGHPPPVSVRSVANGGSILKWIKTVR
jgi:hypothetical protein